MQASERQRRTMSASARAKIAAAQRARWAKQKGKAAAKKSARKKAGNAMILQRMTDAERAAQWSRCYCPTCKKKFDTTDEYRTHYRQEHKKRRSDSVPRPGRHLIIA
jgi:hypothetical protein